MEYSMSEAVKTARRNFEWGVSLYRQNHLKEAIGVLTQVLGQGFDDALVNYHLGLAYAGCGDYDRAKEHYLKAIKLNPQDAYAYNRLGFVYEQAGDNDRALECYLNARRLNPDYPWPLYNLGCLYKKLGLYDESMEAFSRFTDMNAAGKVGH